MSWLRRLFGSKADTSTVRARRLHKQIVKKARTPELYEAGLLTDSLEGRFHGIALYAALVFPVLEAGGAEGKAVSASLNTQIFDAFDAALRETGVGDASIARKIRKMGEEFFGIGLSVNEAARSNDQEGGLAEVLARNHISPVDRSRQLSRMLIEDYAVLRSAPVSSVLGGDLPW